MTRVAMTLRVATSFVLAAEIVALTVAPGMPSMAPLVLIATGAISILLAAPLYVVLRRFRRETWWACMLAG